ncbi:hypothetical protein OGAPHI_000042 [Ogataea philodendri]|uniref:Uncharacterized protein n=1 Tax=Ogataea philodendri TaxID=1378263 RepID=A0A9P8TB71_9ASCO|nr:uncharacterized protein OGAPHI_000042 [Ogataea philodendri]KAH3671856.1 hypothetical protein OGAPHI_000042 [Ogataea philodendri]
MDLISFLKLKLFLMVPDRDPGASMSLADPGCFSLLSSLVFRLPKECARLRIDEEADSLFPRLLRINEFEHGYIAGCCWLLPIDEIDEIDSFLRKLKSEMLLVRSPMVFGISGSQNSARTFSSLSLSSFLKVTVALGLEFQSRFNESSALCAKLFTVN